MSIKLTKKSDVNPKLLNLRAVYTIKLVNLITLSIK